MLSTRALQTISLAHLRDLGHNGYITKTAIRAPTQSVVHVEDAPIGLDPKRRYSTRLIPLLLSFSNGARFRRAPLLRAPPLLPATVYCPPDHSGGGGECQHG